MFLVDLEQALVDAVAALEVIDQIHSVASDHHEAMTNMSM